MGDNHYEKNIERDISAPLIFPNLRKQPISLNHELEKKKTAASSFINIGMTGLNLQKSKDDSVFKILMKEENSDITKNRSSYLKELVNSMGSFFPSDLKHDKLPKKINIRKLMLIEQANITGELLAKKRHYENIKREKEIEKEKFKQEKEKKNTKISKEEHTVFNTKNEPNLNEDNYMRKKDSTYYERNRRESLDMLEYKLHSFNKKQIGDNKLQEDESVAEENKSVEEESFNEYPQESDDNIYASDDDKDVGGYSDY